MTSCDIAKLWAVCGSGLAHLNRCAPRSEIWLTSYAVLAMSGEAYPDCNMAVIDVGGEPQATLTSFVGRLRERRLPVSLTSARPLLPGWANWLATLSLKTPVRFH